MNKATLVAAALLLTAPAANANLISFFETQFDTDYAFGGVGGLRGNGFGDITLSGISGTVTQAYMYWHGPTNSTDPGHNASVTLNGTGVTGTNIGFSDDNFWGRDNSQAYRADVTSIVTGDGTYSLAGAIPADSNGASIVAFYDDGDDTNNRDIVTFDGNDANFSNSFDPDGWDITLAGINYSGGSAFLHLGVSDGQDFVDGDFFLNGSLLLSGLVFQGVSVPSTPGSSVTNGGLWDILTVDITSFLSVGLNTLNLTHTGVSDALSAIHIAIDLPAGAAPPMMPEPGTVLLIGGGLLGFAATRRRRS